MKADWRYLPVCLLVGVGVCSVVGAGAGVVRALTADGGTDGGALDLLGTLVASALGGLLVGAALGCLLGALSGVAATLVTRGRSEPVDVARRVTVVVAATYLVALVVVAGLTADGGWGLPSPLAWAGILVPTVLAALVAGRAARKVPTL